MEIPKFQDLQWLKLCKDNVFPPAYPNLCLNCDSEMLDVSTIVFDRIYNGDNFMDAINGERKMGGCIQYLCLDCYYMENVEDAYGKWFFLIDDWELIERQTLLLYRGLSPESRFFCSKCRCYHRADSVRGFRHLEHKDSVVGDKICVACSNLLPKHKRKFCSEECIEKNRDTCKICGVYFGKGSKEYGYSGTRLCLMCSFRSQSKVFKRIVGGVLTVD